MKFVLNAVLIGLGIHGASADVHGVRLGGGMAHLDIATDKQDPLEVLKSDLCAPFMQEKKASIEEILEEFNDEEIIEYACNDIERKKTSDRIIRKGHEAAKGANRCNNAYAEYMSSDAGIHASLGSRDTCGIELEEALAVVKNPGTFGVALEGESDVFCVAGAVLFIALVGCISFC